MESAKKIKLMLYTVIISLIILQNLFSQDYQKTNNEGSNSHSLQTDTLKTSNKVQQLKNSDFEIFPILSYDTDIGFGYGLKSFFLNFLGINESFDLVLFNSTKGERWYRFVFSIPDFELRQGKVYPYSLDLVVDYDKWINNSFFGVGNNSSFSDREYYTREPFEISVVFSRGFTERFVGQVGVKYLSIKNHNFSNGSNLSVLPPDLNKETAIYNSININFRFDSRNSYINPSQGLVLESEAEFAPSILLSNVAFNRYGGSIQYYTLIFLPEIVFASRFVFQALSGENLPVQVLLSIGGNRTLRGYVQDRFLDKVSALFNTEIRFPIYWRFGGIVGFDAGKVWSDIGKFDLMNWATNPVFGLRFNMDNFIVRADIGISKETTGFYFNFGHLF
ncbi:MAG: BamA/TamA family outer membrane protein [Bacteroidota bacterium]